MDYDKQLCWNLLRDTADEDTALVIATAGDFAHKPATAISLPNRLEANDRLTAARIVSLIICGGAAADKTFSYNIYAYRDINGPAELVATGTGTIGSQAVVLYPHDGSTATNIFWADTLTDTGDWIGDGVRIDDSGNNRVCKLTFDVFGYRWLYAEILEADGTTGTQAGDITVYYSFVQ